MVLTWSCNVRDIASRAGASVDEAELTAFVKDRLAAYKYPRFIEFVPELPKTATGKIQRFKLRDLERERGEVAAAQTATAAAAATPPVAPRADS